MEVHAQIIDDVPNAASIFDQQPIEMITVGIHSRSEIINKRGAIL
jgi:hypothetical protein